MIDECQELASPLLELLRHDINDDIKGVLGILHNPHVSSHSLRLLNLLQ